MLFLCTHSLSSAMIAKPTNVRYKPLAEKSAGEMMKGFEDSTLKIWISDVGSYLIELPTDNIPSK